MVKKVDVDRLKMLCFLVGMFTSGNCIFMRTGATLVVSGDGRFYSKEAIQVNLASFIFN